MNGFSQRVYFGAEHPSLPGHFPGQPLVPGVLILEQVALALRAWRGQRLARVLEAKFMAPLLPGQSAQLQLSPMRADTARAGFQIECDGMVLARGIVEGAA
jgi:3-hydroxymyristoyl/3-hydroxydecanoyl-(acyl carrier protein) dehydratase